MWYENRNDISGFFRKKISGTNELCLYLLPSITIKPNTSGKAHSENTDVEAYASTPMLSFLLVFQYRIYYM